MDIKGPFTIDDKRFSKEELCLFSAKKLEEHPSGSWEHDLYSFIIDFLDGQTPLLQKTSGTTGDPKSLILSREAMIESAKMTLEHFDLDADSRVLLCLPVQYIAGKMMVVRSLVGQLNLITTDPSSRPLLQVKGRIDFASMVPMQVFETIKNNDPLAEIAILLIGGGMIDKRLLRRIQKLKKTRVFESFAMAETYTHFAIRHLNAKNIEDLFVAMKGVTIDVDERGCLVVDVPGVTNGTVQTNDLVSVKDKHSFRWQGRIDNVIKSGGVKIIPEILEDKIREHIQEELLILGIPDEKLGQKLVMVIESKEESFSSGSLLTKMAGLLEKHEIPKAIIRIGSIPRNKSMKPDRIAMLKMLKKDL